MGAHLTCLIIRAVVAVATPAQGYEGDGQPVRLCALFLQTPPTALVQLSQFCGQFVILHADSPISTSRPGVELYPDPDIGHQLSPHGNQSCQAFLVCIDVGEIRLRDSSVKL